MKDLIAIVAGVKRRRTSQLNHNEGHSPAKSTVTCRSETSWPTLSSIGPPRPYLTEHGDLVIPFDSPERYHWWISGQTILDTLAEIERNLSKETP